jgi:DNA-binding GntR family transcriptional regulator
MNINILHQLTPRVPLRDQAFLSLRKAILLGRFKPGQRLIEENLAQKMAISRTPVREALRKLELEGLVNYVPRKGVVVVGVSTEDALEIYAIRAVLEGFAAGLAAQKRTDRELRRLKMMLLEMEENIQLGKIARLHMLHTNFHTYIAKISHNPKLYQLIVSLREYVESFTDMSYFWPDRLQGLWAEHVEIVVAIREADVDRAERAARKHLMHLQAAFSPEVLQEEG